MTPSDPVSDLVQLLRAGGDALARELFDRFSQRLLGLAHGHLNEQLRRKVDPEDIVQSVYKSFFRRLEADQLEIAGWDNLWSLLTVMTVRKCATRAEYFQAGRRDARREVDLDGTDSRHSWRPLIDREPSPEEGVLLAEMVRGLVAEFDAEDRDIIVLSFQGHSVREISAELNRAERSVRRLRERLRLRLEQMLEESAG